MKKSIKRLLLAGISTLLFVSTFLAVIPQTQTIVYADTGKAVVLVDNGDAPNINGALASNVYFGNYYQSNDTSKEPVKWRVLQNGSKKLFLLSYMNLDAKPVNDTSEGTYVWKDCSLRKWLNGTEDSSFINTAFDDREIDAIAPTANVSATDTDKLFLLSLEEVQNTDYGFPSNPDRTLDTLSRVGHNTVYAGLRGADSAEYGDGRANQWWLRSPGKNANQAALVNLDGSVLADGLIVSYAKNAVRPALNVDLSSVILTSAAEGGKNSGTVGAGALTEPAGYDGSEGWKLTVLDSSRSFSAVRTDSGKVLAGRDISISYAGATVGEDEFVSAILINSSGEVLYYGRIVDKSSGDAAGTANITIPAGLADGTYTVKVFSEQYHTDKKTDYASDSSDISIEVGKNTPTADDFAVTLPTNTVYDGKAKTATAKTVPGVEGMGAVTVNYYKDGTKLAGAPTDPGTYTVKLDVAEGDNYSAAADITKSDWTFTIQALYSVKAENDGHGTAEADPVSAMAQTTINLKAIASTGYEFKNWTSSDGVEFANATSATTTFKMPAKNVTVKANFEPTRKDISKATVSGIKNKTYTGKALKQSPVVKLDGKTLKVDIDYTLSYKNNKNAGTAKVTITGKGDYTGSVTKSFKIKQAANKLNVKAKKATYTASYSKNKNKSIVGTRIYKFTNKKKTKGTIKYTLSSVKKDGKKVSKGFSVSKSNGKLTIKKGVAKGTYKITVKVTAGDKNYKTVKKDVKFNLTIK